MRNDDPGLLRILREAAEERRAAEVQARKQAWVREYERRTCAYPGCETHPSFGYEPPFCPEHVWTCREHRIWFEQSRDV